MYFNVLAEMARAGMTREYLAKKLGVSLPTLRRKINGEIDFKLSEIKILISLFGNNVSFEYLFEE